MTSKKVVIGAVVVVMTGCNVLEHAGWQHDVLTSPYPQRRLLAVAVLSNESGSSAADGVALADHLVHQLLSPQTSQRHLGINIKTHHINAYFQLITTHNDNTDMSSHYSQVPDEGSA